MTILGLLSCDQQTLSQMDRWLSEVVAEQASSVLRFTDLHGKNALKCSETRVSVVKTIRLHSNRLLPWLLERKEVKVLHLVRDPRWPALVLHLLLPPWPGTSSSPGDSLT